MLTEDIKKEYSKIKEDILKYDEAYYDKNESLISDYEYDMLRKKLEKMENDYPELGNMGINKVGHKSSHDRFPKIKHKIRMTSLKNTYNIDDIYNFIQSVASSDMARTYIFADGTRSDEICGFVIQPKFDGLSLSLIYENGKLVQAITRGDGETGEDVTENVRHIKSIPQEFNSSTFSNTNSTNFADIKGRLEVRGEILMSYEEFSRINKLREDSGLQLYANPRNLASGTLRNLDPSILDERELIFIAYEVYFDTQDNDPYSSYIMRYLDLINNGFNKLDRLLSDSITIPTSKINSKEYINDIFNKIFASNFLDSTTKFSFHKLEKYDHQGVPIYYNERTTIPIDGIVIKANISHKDERAIGFTGERYPKFAVAYKFEPEAVETTLRDVIFQVGRTGKITPVAIMDSVYIDGSTVSRCTLHNFNEIESLGLRKNCAVLVCKAAAIIPQIIKRIPQVFPNEEYIEIPKVCPICGSPLNNHKNLDGSITADAYCDNRECDGRILAGMIFHLNALGIKGIGSEVAKVIIQIYKENMNTDSVGNCKGRISEFLVYPTFNLLYDKVVARIGFKNASKILDSIREKANENTPLWRQILSLGINTIGESTSKIIAKNYNSFGELFTTIVKFKTGGISKEDIDKLTNVLTMQNIDNIFEDVYENSNKFNGIVEFIMPHTKMNFTNNSNVEIVINKDGIFKDQNVVITGSFGSKTREEMERYVTMEGGKVVGSVSKNTTLLLCGDNPGNSKVTKADSLGIRKITREELGL